MSGAVMALIGAGGAVVGAVAGALIQAFGPRLYERITQEHKSEPKAIYNAHFVTEFPESKRRKFDEVVSLTSLPGNKLAGRGSNRNRGQYRVVGEHSQFCDALIYYSIVNPELVAGVILVKHFPDTRNRSGKWAQLDRDGDLVGGAVEFEATELE